METKKQTALFIGRFQPFHRGHLFAVKWIARRSARVVIAIGSAEKSFEEKNPLTAKERMGMIQRQIREEGMGAKCKVVAVRDVPQDSEWVSYVDKCVPAYDVVYSNNPLVGRLMKKAGKKVFAVPFFRKGIYDATRIRARIKGAREWHSRVPEKILAALERLHVEKRLGRMVRG